MALYWELDKEAKNEKSNKPIVIILIFLRHHLLASLGVHRAGPDR